MKGDHHSKLSYSIQKFEKKSIDCSIFPVDFYLFVKQLVFSLNHDFYQYKSDYFVCP